MIIELVLTSNRCFMNKNDVDSSGYVLLNFDKKDKSITCKSGI